MNADAFARELGLQLDDVPVCVACLSFVAFAVDAGDEREIRRWTRTMTPDLWDDGLAVPLKLAVERAHRAGMRGAREALADLELHGSRSRTARAIVRRLGEQLAERAKRDPSPMGRGRLEPE